jgi:Raf kinase inhibitor-like YbhB/YbcL family protein
MAAFELSSPAFPHGGQIPRRHTCEGEDLSPALTWTGPPQGTVSLALIVDDPDAPGGTFTHWLAWGLEPEPGGLAEGEAAPDEGENDFGRTGYGGPCPPRGHGPHRYFFRLYAVESEIALGPGAGRTDLEEAIGTGALAVAELTGTYER